MLRSFFCMKMNYFSQKNVMKMKLHYVSVQPIKYVFEFWIYRKHDFVQLYKLNLAVSVFVCLLVGTVREKIKSGQNDTRCQVEEIEVNFILIILTAA